MWLNSLSNPNPLELYCRSVLAGDHHESAFVCLKQVWQPLQVSRPFNVDVPLLWLKLAGTYVMNGPRMWGFLLKRNAEHRKANLIVSS